MKNIKRENTIKLPKIVQVRWLDAAWTDNVDLINPKAEASERVSVGFVLKNDGNITLAGDYFIEENHFRELVSIPKGMIIKMEKPEYELIHWYDASFIDDSFSRTLDKACKVAKVSEVYSVGFLLDKNKDRIRIYKTYSVKSNKAHAVQVIPTKTLVEA